MLLLIAGCAKKPPPTVTNTQYFDQKIWDLTLELVNNSSKRIKKAAVLEIKNADGRTSYLGKYLSTKFSTIAVKRQLFVVPSDGEVLDAMTRQNIKYNGTLDRAEAKKLGEALKVDGLIIGSLSDLQKGSDIDLIVSIIEVRSGNIVSSANTNLLRSKSVSTMMQTF
jgi:hypothetical protein